MRTDRKTIEELERLLSEYIDEVEQRRNDKKLTNSTADTYLRHSNNFVNWCKEKFVPGGRNL